MSFTSKLNVLDFVPHTHNSRLGILWLFFYLKLKYFKLYRYKLICQKPDSFVFRFYTNFASRRFYLILCAIIDGILCEGNNGDLMTVIILAAEDLTEPTKIMKKLEKLNK